MRRRARSFMACRMSSGRQSTRRTRRNRFPARATSTDRITQTSHLARTVLRRLARSDRVGAKRQNAEDFSMPDVGGIAGERLKSFIERVERLEEEKRALAEDIKEVYAEAKGVGFDTKIMRQLIKIPKMDKDDLDEQETLLDVYKRAIGMLPSFEDETKAAK